MERKSMAVIYQFEPLVSAAGLSNQLKTELNDVFKRNLRYAISHRREVTGHEIISVKTQEIRCWNLLSSLEELIKVGRYEIHSLYSLKEKHIEWFISYWIERKLTYGTIANKISYLKALAIWLRKPNIIKDLDSYPQLKVLPKRTGVADRDKSWTSKDVDVRELIEKVARFDKYVGIQLALQLAYGLRRQESMMLIPASAFMEVNGHRLLLIDRGAKGNRERVVKRYLDDDADMRIFELAKLLSNEKTGSTIPSHKSLDQWINYYKSVMKKFGITKDELGITSHGLRHQFLNDLYEVLTGTPSAARGGDMPAIDLHKMAQLEVSKVAGHNRPGISNAYISSHAHMEKKKRALITDEQIRITLNECGGNKMHAAQKLNVSRSALYVRLGQMAGKGTN
jgi:integrase